MLAKSRIIIFTVVTICMMIAAANAETLQGVQRDMTPDESRSLINNANAGTLNDIPLVWKPTDNISEMEYIDLSYLKKHQIMVNNFSDNRENKNEIGRNTEKESKIKLVTTKDNIAAWCTDRFKYVTGEFGVNISDASPTIIIDGEIERFYVHEQNLYKSEVVIKLTAKTNKEKTIWEGIIKGNSSRWGKSYSAENYYEAISNAFIEAIYEWLKNDSFVTAVKSN